MSSSSTLVAPGPWQHAGGSWRSVGVGRLLGCGFAAPVADGHPDLSLEFDHHGALDDFDAVYDRVVDRLRNGDQRTLVMPSWLPDDLAAVKAVRTATVGLDGGHRIVSVGAAPLAVRAAVECSAEAGAALVEGTDVIGHVIGSAAVPLERPSIAARFGATLGRGRGSHPRSVMTPAGLPPLDDVSTVYLAASGDGGEVLDAARHGLIAAGVEVDIHVVPAHPWADAYWGGPAVELAFVTGALLGVDTGDSARDAFF